MTRHMQQEQEIRLDAKLRWELSQTLLEKGWYAQAARELEKIRGEVPEDGQVLALLGTAYLLDGDWKNGCAVLERTLAQQPSWQHLHWILAEAYLLHGDPKKAGPHLKLMKPMEQGESPL